VPKSPKIIASLPSKCPQNIHTLAQRPKEADRGKKFGKQGQTLFFLKINK